MEGNMKEYIERDTAVAFLENMAASRYLIQCFENKEKFPAADVAPIKHGEWERIEKEGFWTNQMEESLMTGKPTKQILPRCSCCKKVFGTIAFDFKFCPECGVRIKEKENNK